MADGSLTRLAIHGRYGRREAFASVGVEYSQQNRSLNTGLSPRCPDGGFFIFVTLDKDNFDPRHDYEDQLFRKKFIWVTRRGRGEDHKDYVTLRHSGTRVSLFVRLDGRDKFVYAGELVYESHRQFVDKASGEVQQSYTWSLKVPLNDNLLSELTLSDPKDDTDPSQTSPTGEKTRGPSSFDEYKRDVSYALGSLERTLVQAHFNFQVRLKKFLTGKGIVPDFEKDFVDVSFDFEGKSIIGEIKVTGFLSLNQAFRIALGQLLEYAHLRFDVLPQMVMFLDHEPDGRRVALATKFSIAVVVEDAGEYRLLNPTAAGGLMRIFSPTGRTG